MTVQDQKAGCFANWLGFHHFRANRFPFLHVVAYGLLDMVRRLVWTIGVPTMTLPALWLTSVVRE